MAQIFIDRVQETTSNSGTGTYTLLGASSGYQSFAKIGDGNTCYYAVSNGSSWEVGNGKYIAANTALIRVTILASSNADNAVNWTTDTKTIFNDIPAAYLANTGLGPWAQLNSPTFTGTPAAPTAAAYTSTTQLATTAFVADAITKETGINFQTGTTYTLVLSDAGRMIDMSNTSAITLTIPNNATVAFSTNTIIDLMQSNTGQVTVAGAGAVTIRSVASKVKLTSQWSGATLIQRTANEWILMGDIS